MVNPEQHDDEQKQHDDCACVDNDLHRRKKMGFHRNEVNCDSEQRQYETEC